MAIAHFHGLYRDPTNTIITEFIFRRNVFEKGYIPGWQTSF